jgi:hypothetical protein
MLTVPDGDHSVTPWIISRDTVRLLEFVVDAFRRGGARPGRQ